MQYKFFTFPVTQYATQEEELNTFLRTHRVVEIEKQLVTATMPMWCFAIGYIQQGKKESYTKSVKVNYEEILSKEEFQLFEKYRKVRKEVAAELNVPAYAVFTNKELAKLCKEEQLTTETLLSLEGFGEGRFNKTGQLSNN